jgi:hypothetical protein
MTVTAGRVTKRTIVPANSSATRRSTTDYGAAIKTRRPILHPPITPSKPRQSTAQAKSARGNHRNGSDGYSTATKPTTTPTTAAESLATTTTATATTTGAKRTAKGREVFSRGKLAEEEQQKQKREKEEAARKARAAAAEKGRLASRQWAEKQKQRKTPTVLAKTTTTTTTTMADGTGDVTVMGGGEAALADGEASC